MIRKKLTALLVALLAGTAAAQSFTASSTASIDPVYAPTIIPASYFGLNVGDTVNQNPSMPFGTLVTNGRVTWATMNPASGVYDWSKLDQLRTFATAHKAELLIILTGTPAWASSQPAANCKDGAGTCAPPASMASWDTFLAAYAAHVGTSVNLDAVWNEVQDPGYWSGTVAQMVTMTQHARTILKAANPAAKIISPSITDFPVNGPAWLVQFLAAGGGQTVDVISYHGYYDQAAESIRQLHTKMQATVKPGGSGSLPIWNTESDAAGYNSFPLPLSQQPAFIAQTYLLQWSLGIQRFVWYAYDGGIVYGGMLVPDSNGNSTTTETSAAKAYGEMYRWMVGAAMPAGCAKDGSGTYSCTLTRPEYRARAVWNSTATPSITVPFGVRFLRKLDGTEVPVTPGQSITIGSEPQLLESGALPSPSQTGSVTAPPVVTPPVTTPTLPVAAAALALPAAGTYTAAQNVALSTPTLGGIVHYTLDGSTPTCSSPAYTAPIALATTTTIKAVACALNFTVSPVASFAFVINLPVTPPATSAVDAMATMTLGVNKSFGSFHPLAATDVSARDISTAPLSFMNDAFHATYDAFSIKPDSSIVINAVDSSVQAGHWFSVKGGGGDNAKIFLTGSEQFEGQSANATPRSCWATNNTDSNDHHTFSYNRDPAHRMLVEIYQGEMCGGVVYPLSARFYNLAQPLDPQQFFGGDSIAADGTPMSVTTYGYDETAAGVPAHGGRFTTGSTSALYYTNGSPSCGQVGAATHGSRDKCTGDATKIPLSLVYGTTIRLKADFDISGYSPIMQNLLKSWKKYGRRMQDTGSVQPYGQFTIDPRWNPADLDAVGNISLKNFEVVAQPGLNGPDTVISSDTNDDADGSDSVVSSFTQTANAGVAKGSAGAYNVTHAVMPAPFGRPSGMTLTVDKTSIALGDTVRFTYTATNAKVCLLDNATVFTEGNTQTWKPDDTATYTLACTGPMGRRLNGPSVTVTVTGTRVATPVLSVAPGAYSSVQTLTVTSATPGANLFYMDDGEDAECYNSKPYTGPITVSRPKHFSFAACGANMLPSAAMGGFYNVVIPGAMPIALGGTDPINRVNPNGNGQIYTSTRNWTAGNTAHIHIGWLFTDSPNTFRPVVKVGNQTATIIPGSEELSVDGNWFNVDYYVPGLTGGAANVVATFDHYVYGSVNATEISGTSGFDAVSTGNTITANVQSCGTVTTSGTNRLVVKSSFAYNGINGGAYDSSDTALYTAGWSGAVTHELAAAGSYAATMPTFDPGTTGNGCSAVAWKP